MTRATETIRKSNPDRLVQIDGLSVGTEVISYEDWHGHQLDRQLLTMLQEEF